MTPTVPTPHTEAWIALERNLESISHMVALAAHEIASGKTMTKRRTKFQIGDLSKKEVRARQVRSLKRFTSTLQVRLDRTGTVWLWQVVMLVTCVEAYLQDLLVAAALVDREFMKNSKQVAAYADVVSAKSLEELATEMRRRWARGWLNDGGPTRWISTLQKMGAKEFPVGLAPRLELI